MTSTIQLSEEERLAQFLLDEGYLEVRILPDGTVNALMDLMFTRAILIDCTYASFTRRFCFEDREKANEWFLKLNSADDVPTEGYVARRPQYENDTDPYLKSIRKYD